MQLRVKDHRDLQKLMHVLACDIVDAGFHFKLLLGIQAAGSGEYLRAISQAHAFWSFTSRALLESNAIRLCKVYDQHHGTLSLLNLLHTIEAHPEYFAEPLFRERLQGNRYVDSLCKKRRTVDPVQLQQDIAASCEKTDTLVLHPDAVATAPLGPSQRHKGAQRC